ncbi:hypothetical protein AABB24_014363 [Solanum stoloniferum]|uniref:Uncharacterized protein n=1 Tax=Solanum stoloniferum TaxID=62892 RepID=A0ABD2U137_9SOLN
MFSSPSNSQSPYSAGQTHASSPQFRQQSFTSTQSALYPNGSVPGTTYTQGSNTAWNEQISQQQLQSPSPVYGGQSSSFPPPPWEAEAAESSQTVELPSVLSSKDCTAECSTEVLQVEQESFGCDEYDSGFAFSFIIF